MLTLLTLHDDTDFLRDGTQLLTQRLIELEAATVIGQTNMSEHRKDPIAGTGIRIGPRKRELAISI